jgi:hypothetical protein
VRWSCNSPWWGALREWMLNLDTVSLQRDGMAALELLLSSFAAEAPAKQARKATVAQRLAAQR